jgi:hypothetical protein
LIIVFAASTKDVREKGQQGAVFLADQSGREALEVIDCFQSTLGPINPGGKMQIGPFESR